MLQRGMSRNLLFQNAEDNDGMPQPQFFVPSVAQPVTLPVTASSNVNSGKIVLKKYHLIFDVFVILVNFFWFINSDMQEVFI